MQFARHAVDDRQKLSSSVGLSSSEGRPALAIVQKIFNRFYGHAGACLLSNNPDYRLQPGEIDTIIEAFPVDRCKVVVVYS